MDKTNYFPIIFVYYILYAIYIYRYIINILYLNLQQYVSKFYTQQFFFGGRTTDDNSRKNCEFYDISDFYNNGLNLN